MARPPKLTPAQREEINRRLAGGEGVRKLAEEFKVGPATICRISVPKQTERVRELAHQLADAKMAVAKLPVRQQVDVHRMSDVLCGISQSVAGVADLSAKTAYRFASLANTEAGKIDDANVMSDESVAAIKGVAVLQKMANEASIVPMGLLSANRAAVEKANTPDPTAGLDSSARSARVAQLMQLADQRKKATEDQSQP